jgi:hypothetical protein
LSLLRCSVLVELVVLTLPSLTEKSTRTWRSGPRVHCVAMHYQYCRGLPAREILQMYFPTGRGPPRPQDTLKLSLGSTVCCCPPSRWLALHSQYRLDHVRGTINI